MEAGTGAVDASAPVMRATEAAPPRAPPSGHEHASISRRISRGMSELSAGIRSSVVSISNSDDRVRLSTATLSLLTSRKSRADDPDLEKAGEPASTEEGHADSQKKVPIGRDSSVEVRRPLHFLTLPNELKLMLLRYLDFADIERLRRTCKQLRELANPKWIRTMYGPDLLRTLLLGHCKLCLRYDPFRSNLLRARPGDEGFPLASKCIPCAVKQDDKRIRIGKRVQLASFENVWVCRWCGMPITEGAAYGHEQFHRRCYKRYNDVLFLFFILGWLQLGLGTTGAALSFRYYRDVTMVFAPALVSLPPLIAQIFQTCLSQVATLGIPSHRTSYN